VGVREQKRLNTAGVKDIKVKIHVFYTSTERNLNVIFTRRLSTPEERAYGVHCMV
jgi:hypothetical protein